MKTDENCWKFLEISLKIIWKIPIFLIKNEKSSWKLFDKSENSRKLLKPAQKNGNVWKFLEKCEFVEKIKLKMLKNYLENMKN